MKSRIEKIQLEYNGKLVNGRRLTVVSEIPISIESAWNEVQKSSLLEFVAKNWISFKPFDGKFPKIWKEGMKVKARILLFGFIPFGGVHISNIVEIDNDNHTLVARESNGVVKIWNHTISMLKIERETRYKDEIEIYAGLLTSFVSYWANSFYKHRQRRWLLVAKRIKADNFIRKSISH